MFGIILAGGSGSRLWPLSRDLYPKQLLNLNSDKSLVQTTFERINKFIPADKIISTTNAKHLSIIKMQLKEFTETPIVLSEPETKNTAPAIAVATKFIVQNYSDDEIILVVPSDHLIKDEESFANSIQKGISLAKQGYIVTFGVKPSYVETGFGYIQTSLPVDSGYEVKTFVEKPDSKDAEKFITEQNCFWNSGIFMFKASTMLNELEQHAPEIFSVLQELNFKGKNEIPYLTFTKMPNISIDYAVMEKCNKIAMVKLESDWKDLGSWQSIYEISPKDANNNVMVGHVLDMGSKNSFVYASSKLVATIGLEDTVVIETEDAILACPKNRTQDVKQIYETLKQQNDDTHSVHRTVYRPWGFYTVIAQGKGFLTKIIHVKTGQKLSVQSHNYRSEHWVVLSGNAKVVLEGKEMILSPGHSVDIPVKAIHSLQNPFEEDLEIIEVQKGDPLIEEDIIRYEDIYGRV